MPQTLLALLALAVASMMALNVKGGEASTYEHQIQDEFEMTASAVALQIMELAEERPFDERTTPDEIEAHADFLPVPGGAEFSRWDSFGGTACDLEALWTTADCDDLDDLTDVARQTIAFQMRGSGTLDFQASVEVEYVLDEDFEVESALPTDHKRVVVLVFLHPDTYTRRDRDVPLVRLERVVSYDDRKAARDFQRATGRWPAGMTG